MNIEDYKSQLPKLSLTDYISQDTKESWESVRSCKMKPIN